MILSCLLLSLGSIVSAILNTNPALSRLLLIGTGLMILILFLPLPAGIPSPRRRLRRCPQRVLSPLTAFSRSTELAVDGLGWSYGEIRNRIFAELRFQVRGILGLVSLFVITQALIGIFWMSVPVAALFMIEVILWSGILLGLHLGLRAWRALRVERVDIF